MPRTQNLMTMSRTSHKQAFTLLELLAVIAVIGIIAALLLPALSRGTQRAQGTFCLNNGRQMMLALTMYGADYHDYFPPNPDDGNVIPGHNWCSGDAGTGGRDEFNPDILEDPSRSLLIPYLNHGVSVFHCPGDKRMGLYQGANPNLLGKRVAAARTFSMNQAVGTICPGFDAALHDAQHSGVPNLPVNGPWLDNSNAHRRNRPWQTYGKISAVSSPSPAMLWVILDENPKELNDAAFAFGMQVPGWLDVPGTYHDFACGFAFADCHSESHHWASRSDKKRQPFVSGLEKRDWLWMRERTSSLAGQAQ